MTTLTGGILGLASLWYQRWGPLIRPTSPGSASARERARCGPTARPPAPDRSATLPYGIAIAAGGVAVVVELMKL